MKKIGIHVNVKGRVQGVFFRLETKNAAEKIGVNGWVRNKTDGTVEALFEGDEDKVRQAVLWCRKGSGMSLVESVDENPKEYTGGYSDFVIRY